MEIDIHATADPQGKILLHVHAESGEDWEIRTIDLDHLLATKLYRTSYPREEAHRLKNMHGLRYDYTDDNNALRNAATSRAKTNSTAPRTV